MSADIVDLERRRAEAAVAESIVDLFSSKLSPAQAAAVDARLERFATLAIQAQLSAIWARACLKNGLDVSGHVASSAAATAALADLIAEAHVIVRDAARPADDPWRR